MAKRSKAPAGEGRTTVTRASAASTAQTMEQRVGAFAEQLGRIVGTIQAKAEGWAKKGPAAGARAGMKKRSGVAGAPVKKRRKQSPAGPAATVRRGKPVTKQTAATAKTNRRRGA